MLELIEALQIFASYRNVDFPTHCEHDELFIVGITETEVSADDKKKLDDLGFHFSENYDCWISHRYGSA